MKSRNTENQHLDSMSVKVSKSQGEEKDLIKSIEKLMSPKSTENRWALVDQEEVMEIQKNRTRSPGLIVKHKRHKTIALPKQEPMLENKFDVPTKPFIPVTDLNFDKLKDFRSRSRSRGLRTL